MANWTKPRLLLVCLVFAFSIEVAKSACNPLAVTGLCLDTQQLNKISLDAPVRLDIRTNYYTDVAYYSKHAPIVTLTPQQIALIQDKYGAFFKPTPPAAVPSSYVYGGTVYGGLGLGRRRRQAEPYVCPSTGVYSDINFCISDAGDVLQMVQLADAFQWVLTETCQDPAANGVPNTICVDRIRNIPAVVVNVDNGDSVAVEMIEVSCCAARETT